MPCLLSQLPEEAWAYDRVANFAISDAYKGAGVRSFFCYRKCLKRRRGRIQWSFLLSQVTETRECDVANFAMSDAEQVAGVRCSFYFCFLGCPKMRRSTTRSQFSLSQVPEKARKYDNVAIFAISDGQKGAGHRCLL